MDAGEAHKKYQKSYSTIDRLYREENHKQNIKILSVRHPIERFISAYHMFCTEKHWFGLAKKKYWNKIIQDYLCRYDPKKFCNAPEEIFRGETFNKKSNWLSLNNLAIYIFTQPFQNIPDLFSVHMSSQLYFCESCTIKYDYIVKTLTISQDWKYLSNKHFDKLDQDVDFSGMINHNDNGLGVDVTGLVEKVRGELMSMDEDILNLMIYELSEAMVAFGYGINRDTLELTGLVS